jgi:hypothetical protein
MTRSRSSPHSKLDCAHHPLRIGTVVTRRTTLNVPFVFTEEMLARHLAVLGTTGSGKSKLLELVMRRLIDPMEGNGGVGFAFLDGEGDTVEDVLGYVAYLVLTRGRREILPRIHYIQPSYDTIFGFDPFRFHPPVGIPAAQREVAYRQWLASTVDKIALLFQRTQGDSSFEGMARLERFLKNVLTATGTAVNDEGDHLPLGDSLVLLQPEHPRHEEVFRRVEPHLTPEVHADFAMLRGILDPRRREEFTQSTINRMRAVLSPVTQAIFSQTEHVLNLRQIVSSGDILLGNFKQTDYFSKEQGRTISGALINEILTETRRIERIERRRFYLFTDENTFLGQDLADAFGKHRKNRTSVVVTGQHLGSFRKGDFDMTSDLLANAGTFCSFRERVPEDLDVLAPFFTYPLLDLRERRQEAYFPAPPERTTVWDPSIGYGQSRGSNEGQSSGRSTSNGETQSRSTGTQEGWSESTSTGSSTGESNSEGSSRSIRNHDETTDSTSTSAARNQSISESHSRGSNGGRTTGESSGTSRSHGQSFTRSIGTSTGENTNLGLTRKTIFLPSHRRSLVPTGQPRLALDYQFARVATLLTRLPDRHMLVRTRLAEQEVTLLVRVDDVPSCYPSAADQERALDWMKMVLRATHPYLVTPRLGPAAQDDRIQKYLAHSPASSPLLSADTKSGPPSPFDT